MKHPRPFPRPERHSRDSAVTPPQRANQPFQSKLTSAGRLVDSCQDSDTSRREAALWFYSSAPASDNRSGACQEAAAKERVLQAGDMEGARQSRVAPLLLCMAIAAVLQGVQSRNESQTLECFSCIDQGDHGCSGEKVQQVPCLGEHDVCVEAVMGIQSSHEHFTAVIKGCGLGGPGRLDKALPFHGITEFIQVHQCNESLCNTLFDLQKYQLIPLDNSTRVANGMSCYSCIGETENDKCLPSTSPEVQCYGEYKSCFDGNTTVTVGNATVTMPIKSCSKRPVCAKMTLTLGGATFTIRGACCLGNLCNQDLSNKTQLESFSFLELYPHVEETTAFMDNSTGHNMSVSGTPIKVGSSEDGKPTAQTVPLDGKSNDGTPENMTMTTMTTTPNHAASVISPVWAFLLLAALSL